RAGLAHGACGAARGFAGAALGNRHRRVTDSAISSAPRAEGELPHPLGGGVGRWAAESSSAQRPQAPISNSRRTSLRLVLRSVFSLRQPTTSAQATSYVPAGNSLGRVPGRTTARGGT